MMKIRLHLCAQTQLGRIGKQLLKDFCIHKEGEHGVARFPRSTSLAYAVCDVLGHIRSPVSVPWRQKRHGSRSGVAAFGSDPSRAVSIFPATAARVQRAVGVRGMSADVIAGVA